MGNWLEERAKRDDILWRDGVETWRQVKDSAEAIVESFNSIYGAAFPQKEVEVSGCADSVETCFRVRVIPMPSHRERFIEFRYNKANHTIEVTSQGVQPQTFTLSLNDKNEVMVLHGEKDSSPSGIVKTTLEKFLLPEPRRPLRLP